MCDFSTHNWRETRSKFPLELIREEPVAEHESVWSDLQGVPFVQGYLDAGGVRTRYLHAGDSSKPPLILLHGSGGHAEAYVRNLEAHAEHFSTWSIDMLGHGYTDKPGHPLEVRHYVDHLLAFLDAIGVERAHLSGESLGGWVVSRAAVDHPDKVHRLGVHTPGGSQGDPAGRKGVINFSVAGPHPRGGTKSRSRGDEADYHVVDGGRRKPDLGNRAGADHMVDGRQVQGLRRPRREPPAGVPPARFRLGDA